MLLFVLVTSNQNEENRGSDGTVTDLIWMRYAKHASHSKTPILFTELLPIDRTAEVRGLGKSIPAIG